MARGVIKDAWRPTHGNYVLTPPPPPSSGVPRRLVSGICARSRSRADAASLAFMKAGVGGGVVLELYWRDLLPTNTSTLNEAAVLAFVDDLDWAQSHGLGVLVRFFAGYYAPDWVRAAAGGSASGGGMPWTVNDPTTRLLPRGMPCWWKSSYVASYDSVMSKIAAETRISAHPALCGITMSAPCTQYAEPCVKQFSIAADRDQCVANGYTQAADEACFNSGFVTHNNYFTPLGIATYCSYNDYQEIILATGKMKVTPETTVRIIETQIATLGRFAVIENNSLQYPTTKYPTTYQRIRDARNDTPPNPIHFQTETWQKHKDLYDAQTTKVTSPLKTAQTGLGWGASAIEMPSEFAQTSGGRWADFTSANAIALNLQGYNNTIGLDQTHT